MKKHVIISLVILWFVIALIDLGFNNLLIVISALLMFGFITVAPLWLLMFLYLWKSNGIKTAWKECNPAAIYKALTK